VYSSPFKRYRIISARMNSSTNVELFRKRGSELINFLNNSRDPFHAVDSVKNILVNVGFNELREKDCWDKSIVPGGKYLFTRNQSSIVAFAVGKKWVKGNGFSMVGAHTDSPCLKIKPKSHSSNFGYNQVGVEKYGGGLWYTWFDRDLTVGGRVIVSSETGFESKLVYINRPILRIPSLAIHIDRTANEKFEFNHETTLLPIIEDTVKSVFETKKEQSHNSALLELLASTMGVDASKIHSFELSLCDTQDAVIGGLNNEYIFSGRLDNLCSSYCATVALAESVSSENSLDNEENIRLVALYDHEEVGSASAFGAGSTLTMDAMLRITTALNSNNEILASKTNSFFISADMAHAVHPNFSGKHENNHRPLMNKGPVIKNNANQRYASTGPTSLVIEALAKKHEIPIQSFCIRNDGVCGSTIGPIVSSNIGVRTVDIGNPQLSMHSIREICGVDDVAYSINLFKAFFEEFPMLNKTIDID